MNNNNDNNNNNINKDINNNDINNNNETTASTIIKSVGNVLTTVGFALSGVSSLYFIHYLTGWGVALIEYLPILTNNNDFNFSKFIIGRNIGSLKAYFVLTCSLSMGVLIRYIGTKLTENIFINKINKILYNKKKN